MLQILIIIAPLFLIIFLTAFLRKFFSLGKNWSKPLNEFALNIGFPALIFSAIANASFSFQSEFPLILANVVFILISFLFGFLVAKIFKTKKTMSLTLFVCFAFNNIAYLGIPVLTQVSGDHILSTLSLIITVYIFVMFTIGTSYLDFIQNEDHQKAFKNTIKNIVKNPLLISVLLGLIVGTLNIPIPNIIQKSLDMLSSSVTPLVLTIIGLFIGASKFGKLKEWIPVFAFSFATLIIMPSIFYWGLQLFHQNPQDFSLSILEAAMPLAITPFALADKYNLNKDFIARSIVMSTILSIISLPIWISFF